MADLTALRTAVLTGKRKDAEALTQAALDAGIDPGEILKDALVSAMQEVGESFLVPDEEESGRPDGDDEQPGHFLPTAAEESKQAGGCRRGDTGRPERPLHPPVEGVHDGCGCRFHLREDRACVVGFLCGNGDPNDIGSH